MTKIVSIRMPALLAQVISNSATASKITISQAIGAILEPSFGGQYDFRALRDVKASLNAKLQVRLPEELVSKLRAESGRLKVSVSVYSRVILYAYYTTRLVFVEIGDRYTLAANHDQTHGA